MEPLCVTNPECRAIISSLRGHNPEKALVLYSLFSFSDFGTLGLIDRVRAQFCFELYTQGFIDGNQLRRISGTISATLIAAAEKVIPFVNGPISMEDVWTPQRWSHEETMNLFACLNQRHIHQLPRIFAERTPAQCRERIRYVIARLEQWEMQNKLIDHPEAIVPKETRALANRNVVQNQGLLRAKLMREKYINKRQKAMFQGKCLTLQRKIKRLETQLNEIEIAAERSQDDSLDNLSLLTGSSDLQDQLLCEMMFLSHSKEHQRRYSEKMRDVCQLIRLTSPRTYRLLHQILPIPTQEALRYHYSGSFAMTRRMICEQDLLERQLDLLCGDIPEKSLITIGMDAFSFRTFHESSTLRKSNADTTFSDGFLFMHLPLDANMPTKVLHIQKKGNGSFDSSILDSFKRITNMYTARKLKVMFMATDGDRFLTPIHDKFFDFYVAPHRDSFPLLLGQVYEMLINSDEIMPIADPLHFAKNMRGKLIDHNVAVIAADELVLTNAQRLEQRLKLGLSLTDTGQIGRMRDKYVTDIFTLNNVCTLLKDGEVHSAFLLLPYACVFTLLYALNVTTETRLFLANLAFTSFEWLLNQAEQIVKTHRDVKFRYSSGTRAITFTEPSYAKRMMHTCLALGIAIEFGPKDLRLDAIGTHLLENTIGIARSVSNSTDYEKIVSAFANAQIRKEIAKKWNLTLYVSHRVNDGGAKISTDATTGVSHCSEWDTRDIVSLLNERCMGLIAADSTEWTTFCEELLTFSEQIHIRTLSSPSAVSNALIVERNRCYHQKPNP